MTITTLQKANKLAKEIEQFKIALECFEPQMERGGTLTKPRITIQYDGGNGARNQMLLPINVNTRLIELLKSEILSSLEAVLDEFSSLR